uniref:Uncharacterized protein n=1 Tax=Trypanosoma congolense (strain IL3000) TaxID=1068625 RepID=G0USZ1_TRYCI|nr:conserved hypothetical protein [Trypanosoma congolense IL3000]
MKNKTVVSASIKLCFCAEAKSYSVHFTFSFRLFSLFFVLLATNCQACRNSSASLHRSLTSLFVSSCQPPPTPHPRGTHIQRVGPNRIRRRTHAFAYTHDRVEQEKKERRENSSSAVVVTLLPMLRRTLWCLLEKEPQIVRRAIMAKARPHPGGMHGTNSGSSNRATDVMWRRNGVGTNALQRSVDSAASPSGSRAPTILLGPGSSQQQRQQHNAAATARDVDRASSTASDDAYKFLLHHIDSEIAALTRRVTTVGRQRESVEGNQSRRIRQLFECIERPWLLLESIPPPQLPNKPLDVFAKEMYVRQHGTSTSAWEEDALFLSNCRRNWRVLSVQQRKPYEIAARRNEQTRKELKKKINNGCTYFEKLCEQTKEWTAEMVRGELRRVASGKSHAAAPATSSRSTVEANKPTVKGAGRPRTAGKKPAVKSRAEKKDPEVEVLTFEPVVKKKPGAGKKIGRPAKAAAPKSRKAGGATAVPKTAKKAPQRQGAKKKPKKKKK